MPPGILKTVSPDGRGRGHYRIGGPNDANLTSEEVVIAANAGAMVAGTVLGKITASGQYKAFSPALVDGSELPANAVILYQDVPNSTATQKATVDVRDQPVNGRALTYVNTITAPQKAAVEAAMATRSLMVRY